MKVELRGSVSLYTASGSYQFYASGMSPDGLGALYQRFEELKQVYNEYKAEVAKVKNSQSIKQRAVNFIPMVLGGIAAIPNTNLGTWARPVFLGVGAVITLILMATNNKHDIGEDITELQIKYQSRYCCPKCGMKYPFTTHWKKLEADGKCPNPKCDAQFVKPEQ